MRETMPYCGHGRGGPVIRDLMLRADYLLRLWNRQRSLHRDHE
jgi:hypothetical protein